jgi:hypothetical protein
MTTPSVTEKYISPNLTIGSQVSFEKEAFVFDATTAADAVNAALADTTVFPTTTSVTLITGSTVTYVRDSINVKEVEDGKSQPTTWDVNLKYVMLGVSAQPYATGDSVTTFEIGQQQVNKKYSISTSGVFGAADPPDFTFGSGDGGIISPTPDGIDGVDVDVPTFTWSETHYLDNSVVTDAYIAAVYAVANNPINDDTFRNFAAGSVKFLGMQGTRRHNGGDWELNFRFAASPNVTGLRIGDITSIDKLGWEYLWVYYTKSDAITGFTLQLPKWIYVEKVYETSDYTTLGI